MAKVFAIIGWINMAILVLFIIDRHTFGWQNASCGFETFEAEMLAAVAANFAIACYYKK